MRTTSLRRPLLALIATILVSAGMFAVTTPTQAATSRKKVTYTYVTKCTRYFVRVNGARKTKYSCRKVKVSSRSVSSYKPRYNLMTNTGSKRKLNTKGATAVCGDNTYVYGAKKASICSAHHGVAFWFK